MKLVAQDSRLWTAPTGCAVVGEVHHRSFPTGLHLRLDPPVLGASLAQPGPDIDEVYVFPRFAGSTLSPMSEDPIRVHICLPGDFDPAAPLKSKEWGILSS